MPMAAAARLRVSTWLLPVNTMPLRLTIITVPSALIWPWIWLGRASGSFTRFNTDQCDFWSNCRVVFLPTLKLSQFSIALSSVCTTFTMVLPSAWVCTGPWALSQPAVRLLLSTCKPPLTRPSGAPPAASAAWRAAACTACSAAMPRAASSKLFSDCCSLPSAFCCCSKGLFSEVAGWPFGKRPVEAAVPCCAPLPANQAPLNGCCACAPPACSSRAMASASGFRRTG